MMANIITTTITAEAAVARTTTTEAITITEATTPITEAITTEVQRRKILWGATLTTLATPAVVLGLSVC
jgi:hypothetical protein